MIFKRRKKDFTQRRRFVRTAAGIRFSLICFLALGALYLASCGLLGRSHGEPDYNVVVLHSYNDMGQEGSYFRNYMEQNFRRHGVYVNITHIYLDLIHKETPFVDEQGVDRFTDTILSYKPDVLLINDDLAFHYVMDNEDILLKTIPSVFAGVSAYSYIHQDYPLLTGWRDPVDLAANCNLYKTLNYPGFPIVELDYGGYQDQLRERLFSGIGKLLNRDMP